MRQIYEWTPEILKKVRETCRYCAEEQANVWKDVINHKLAVDNLCKKYPSFPRKKYVEAVACYDKVIKLTPNHYIAWYNKATDLARLNKYEEAIACYNVAIKLHPTDSSYWTNKGLVLLLQREYAEAVACFDVSLRLDPLNKTAKKYRTSAKEKQGEIICLT